MIRHRPLSLRLSIVAVVLIVFTALAASSCNDDGGAATNASSGPDQQFVTALCKATDAFGKDFEKATAGPTPADIATAFKLLLTALVKPTQHFADSFAKLTPPPDLVQWHNDSSAKLSAAAKALAAGRLDDPAFEGLSKSPVPELPPAAGVRLAAIAAKTSDCATYSPFTGAAGGSARPDGTAGTPTQALKDAATGTWTGKFGTLEFRPDGSASFSIRNCGTSSPSTKPFGVIDDCRPDDYSGKVEVAFNQYILRGPGGAGDVFEAYLDKAGKLHTGIGTVSAFGPGQKGNVKLFGSGTLVVDGERCTLQPLSGKATATACSWKKQEGRDLLEYTDSFGNLELLVILQDEGLAVSPDIYLAAFDRR